MINQLFKLNFADLLHYDRIPDAENHYTQPPICSGFCTSCEQKGLIKETKSYALDAISHGCHSDIYYKILGPLPSSELSTNKRVLFLLESPGADKFGDPMNYNGVTKRPPVTHYYFSTPDKQWPDNPDSIQNGYGSQFAYLMRYFGLKNIYITNVVKCGKTNEEGFQPYKPGVKSDREIAMNCYKEYLSKEINIFNPDIIFSFGERACHLFNYSTKGTYKNINIQLYHPRARIKGGLKSITKNNREIMKPYLINEG
jgi:hypothetical protein